MRQLGFVIITLLILTPISTQVWAYDSSYLRVPQIDMTPSSGPPGTEITIKVSNFPDISDATYPYPDFYLYLPFAQALGSNIKGQCDGESCFPIYTYEDAKRGNFADKTITFTLFSVTNPKPVYLSGLLHSVCDITVNQKIQQSYTDICNTENQPAGDYQIKFAWGTKTGQYDVVETLEFTVTEGGKAPEPTAQRPDQIIIKQYQDGLISEAEFEKGLKAQGYTDEEIRQTKAVMGKLPHQLGEQAPQQNETVNQVTEKANEATPEKTEETKEKTEAIQEKTEPATTKPKSGCLIATAAFGSELTPQVQFLREFRDNTITATKTGASFIDAFNAIYYSFSPSVAEAERQNPALQQTVKTALYPLLGILQISTVSQTGQPSELSVLSTGFIAASLIGATYVWPAGFALKGVRNGTRPNAKIALGTILITTTSVISALAFADSTALMVSTSILVISLVAVSAIFTSWAIVRLAQKVRN